MNQKYSKFDELTGEQLAALQLVFSSECHLLKLCGWTRVEPPAEKPQLVLWRPPRGYLRHKGVAEGEEYSYLHNHAVNSLKYHIVYVDNVGRIQVKGKKDDDAR